MGGNILDFDIKACSTVRYTIMKELLTLKFSQNPDLMKKLLGTGECKLAESGANTFFAVGWSFMHANAVKSDKWKGKNRLGEALMEVRTKLRNQKS